MSSWTYVHGMVEIDGSASTSAEAIFKAQTIVSHLPRITGSEGPARWTVVPITDWANWSSELDELDHRSNLGVRQRWGTYDFKTWTNIIRNHQVPCPSGIPHGCLSLFGAGFPLGSDLYFQRPGMDR